MKVFLSVLLLILFQFTFAQKNQDTITNAVSHKHTVAVQFGGQTFFSMHYEYSLIVKNHFLLNTNIGIGLNENGDEETGDRPIYGLHTGVISLVGTMPLFFEAGITPTTYFYNRTTFVNINGLLGVRYYPKKLSGLLVAIGYTPKLYSTFTDPTSHFDNKLVAGVKIGVNF